MKAVENEVNAVPSNAVYGLYLSKDRPKDGASILTDWLNADDGQTALHLHARAYGAGLFKLEPKAVRQIEVPLEIAQRVGPVQLRLSRDQTAKTELATRDIAPVGA